MKFFPLEEIIGKAMLTFGKETGARNGVFTECDGKHLQGDGQLTMW